MSSLSLRQRSPEIIGALDIGSTKTTCYIARKLESGNLELLGVGQQLSHGIKSGAVENMDEAENSILKAVHGAEQVAACTLQDVFVNFSCGRPHSQILWDEISIQRVVKQSDIDSLLQKIGTQLHGRGEEVLHAIPIDYSIDHAQQGTTGIRDPLGMVGATLGVRVHVVSATQSPLQNWKTCIARSHLQVQGMVFSPYAAGLATLTEEERDLGVTLIDLGGGTTTAATFTNGKLYHTEFVPLGGAHITRDLVRGLSTSFPHAERLKTLYGSTLPSSMDARDQVAITPPPTSFLGRAQAITPQTVSKGFLNNIIQPRAEEILEILHKQLLRAGTPLTLSHRIVLTGGGSLLPGINDLTSHIFGKPVRIGTMDPMYRTSDVFGDDEWNATAMGLLLFGVNHWNSALRRGGSSSISFGLWNRIKDKIRNSPLGFDKAS